MCWKTFKKGIYSIFPLLLKQPTPLTRLNLFDFFHLFCWLTLYLEWTLLKQTTYILLSVSPAVIAP